MLRLARTEGYQEERMDVTSLLILIACVGSMLISGELAHQLGRSQSRWIWIAALIGPLAIPLLCLVAAFSWLRKPMSTPRP
jgi:hypothetical protein